MAPRLATSDIADHIQGYPKSPCDGRSPDGAAQESLDFGNLPLSQLRPSYLTASQGAMAPPTHHVVCVLSMRPEQQMLRILAETLIARMANDHAGGNRTAGSQFITSPMGIDRTPIHSEAAMEYFGASGWLRAPRPHPAFIRPTADDLRPIASNRLWRHFPVLALVSVARITSARDRSPSAFRRSSSHASVSKSTCVRKGGANFDPSGVSGPAAATSAGGFFGGPFPAGAGSGVGNGEAVRVFPVAPTLGRSWTMTSPSCEAFAFFSFFEYAI